MINIIIICFPVNAPGWLLVDGKLVGMCAKKEVGQEERGR
jgi:hypothetical protein